ncbi:hypothetical protein GCM10018953_02560 [Streptosporangium nondiastaticum]
MRSLSRGFAVPLPLSGHPALAGPVERVVPTGPAAGRSGTGRRPGGPNREGGPGAPVRVEQAGRPGPARLGSARRTVPVRVAQIVVRWKFR